MTLKRCRPCFSLASFRRAPGRRDRHLWRLMMLKGSRRVSLLQMSKSHVMHPESTLWSLLPLLDHWTSSGTCWIMACSLTVLVLSALLSVHWSEHSCQAVTNIRMHRR